MNLCKDAWFTEWILSEYIYWLYTIKVYIYFMNKETLYVLVMWQVIHWYNHKVMIKDTQRYISRVFALEKQKWNIEYDNIDIKIDSSFSVPYGNYIKLEKLQNGVYDILITGAVPHKMKWFSGNIDQIHPNVWTCTRMKWVHKNRTIKPINKSNLLSAVIESLSKKFGYEIEMKDYLKIHDCYETIDRSYKKDEYAY